MAIVRIDHVQLAAPAGCEEAARRFFGGVFGLAEIEKPAALRPRGGVWFALGAGQQLHVGAGALVDWDRSLPDGRRFYTADPWGNRIELVATG